MRWRICKKNKKDLTYFQEQTVMKMYSTFIDQFKIKAICYYNGNPTFNNSKTKNWTITKELYQNAIASIK